MRPISERVLVLTTLQEFLGTVPDECREARAGQTVAQILMDYSRGSE